MTDTCIFSFSVNRLLYLPPPSPTALSKNPLPYTYSQRLHVRQSLHYMEATVLILSLAVD